MKQLEIIKKYLQKLDIEPEATDVYLNLVRLGPSSALSIARKTGISRTQVYRHLEELELKGLVSAEKLSYGQLYRPLPLENIEGIIADRESQNAALRRNLSSMSAALEQIAGTGGQKATIRHYNGIGGLKQVNWNLTKAQKEFRVFEAAHLSQHLDQAFARRCRERYIEKGLKCYDLTNATTIKAAEIEPYDPGKSEARHIDPEILNIDFEIYMYDDVVTFLDYKSDQLHAIEIEHPSLSRMMCQLFDAMWSISKPITIEK